MVKSRVGIGGPQPAEVERMLAGAQATLKADKSWMLGTRQKLKEAEGRLDTAFAGLYGPWDNGCPRTLRRLSACSSG